MPSDSSALRRVWDQRYSEELRDPTPAIVLSQNIHLLPKEGKALDLACGLGANALLLADQGLETAAWDLSPVAIERLREKAKAKGVALDSQVRDVLAMPPHPKSFDVIVVTHFLDRGLIPALIHALRPGGLIYYQTFTREAISDSGPKNPAYRLGTNELLDLFRPLILRVYREEGCLGDTEKGIRNIAMIVAEAP